MLIILISDEEVRRITNAINMKSRSVVHIGKTFLYEQIDLDISTAYLRGTEKMVDNLKMRDAQEGIRSFLEKRKPKWSHSYEKNWYYAVVLFIFLPQLLSCIIVFDSTFFHTHTFLCLIRVISFLTPVRINFDLKRKRKSKDVNKINEYKMCSVLDSYPFEWIFFCVEYFYFKSPITYIKWITIVRLDCCYVLHVVVISKSWFDYMIWWFNLM